MSMEESIIRQTLQALTGLTRSVDELTKAVQEQNEFVRDALASAGRPIQPEADSPPPPADPPPPAAPEISFDELMSKMRDFSNASKKTKAAERHYEKLADCMALHFGVESPADFKDRPEIWDETASYIDTLIETLREKGAKGLGKLRLPFMTDEFMQRLQNEIAQD